ncbi:MAG: type II toxin-antitoxin system VapC family toxin [Chloroflexi bacterium]|nr:type II toxin-antitoxin system VapC family toxin [Chloroflexota bacterium]
MLILDTNVVSELMRDRTDPAVFGWVSAQPPSDLFVTAVTEAEIRVGVAALPVGRRRTSLSDTADRAFRVLFPGRILPLDRAAAREYAAVVSERNAAGRPIGAFDGLIAGIARSRGAAIATRDVSGFDGLGIEIVNPWAAG